MTVDWTRLLRGLGLLAWAGFFDWLWLSGRAATYVGPRTTWVVTFGAITLTAAALLYLAGVPTRRRTGAPAAAELGRLGVVVAPIVLAAMAPAVTLGAQAVDQKRAANGAASTERLADYDGAIRLYELSAAAFDPEWAQLRGIREGLKVDFDGFVSRPADGGALELSRFMATCCAADAVPYSVEVRLPDGAPAFAENTWLRVRGTVAPGPGEPAFVVDAESVREIERPLDAYG
jgi:uncharacterized repeat protein (TIGR03943 family)